jgi:hypothetical protein
MVRVLRQGCRIEGAGRIKCPGAGDLSFRAGFIQVPEGWRMEYFVEGD